MRTPIRGPSIRTALVGVIGLIVAGLVAVAPPASSVVAGIPNGGFETGSFTPGWSVQYDYYSSATHSSSGGYASVVTPSTPSEGTKAAQVSGQGGQWCDYTTWVPGYWHDYWVPGYYDSWGNWHPGYNDPYWVDGYWTNYQCWTVQMGATLRSDAFTVAAGQQLRGAAWGTYTSGSYSSYIDISVDLYTSTGSFVQELYSGTRTAWASLSYTFASAGSYRVEARASGGGTNLLVDGFALKTPQSINVVSLPSSAAYDTSFTVTASATSGLQVTFASSGSCSNVGPLYTMTSGSGYCNITLTQDGNDEYFPATTVYRSVSAARASQAIRVVTPPPSSAVYGSQFTVAATATSGLPVLYGANGGCRLSGTTYTMTSGTDPCYVVLAQGGDGNYLPAQISPIVTAVKAGRTISFAALPGKTYGAAPFSISASANPAATVEFTSTTTIVCTVSGSTVTLKGAGTCSIRASVAGDDNYNPALPVTQSFQVGKAPLTITAPSPAHLTFGDAVPTLAPQYAGFVNGENTVVLTSLATCETTYTQGSAPGTYPVTCSGAAAANYEITYVAGSIIVDPADLTVTAIDKTVQYSDQLPTLTATYGGFVGGDDASDLTGTLSCDTTAVRNASGQVTSPAGTYPITCDGLTSDNYDITFVAGTLTVTKEDAVVRLSQNNPHAVALTSSAKTLIAPAMTFTGRITDAADASFGDITKATPVTLTLTPVGPGSTITKTCDVTRTQPAAATEPGFSLVSCAVGSGVPVNVYEVALTVGGSYFAGSDESVLTVYDPAAGGTNGAGTITNPNTGNTADIAYTAAMLKNAKSVQGKFLYVSRDGEGAVVHVLKGNVMSTMAITGNTGMVTGKATLDGTGNYQYIVTGIDNRTLTVQNPPANPDEFGLKLKDGSGTQVAALTFAPVDVSNGNIFVGK